jgi:putative oxidoreductase
MFTFHFSRAYEEWAPVVGRALFGLLFIHASLYKIPGTDSLQREVAMTAAAGVPLAYIAVILAFFLELLGGLAFLLGWQTRTTALLLAVFVLILNFVFFTDFSNQMKLGSFISNLGLIAGLLYISVYGAQYAAIARDLRPTV